MLVFVAPLLVSWLAVRFTGAHYLRPAGWGGLLVWCLQAIAVASAVAWVAGRVTSRFLPLVSLLGMTLTFPDQAPSRFSVALKTGTVRRLQERVDRFAADGLSSDAATAAAEAVELVTLLGRHERLTRGHTERVRAYADLIAVEMGIGDDDREKLAWAVLLHDIGKLTVPATILNKNGRPTDDEWKILQGHPAAGEAFIEPLADWLGDWRFATSQHHERWDGDGYPRGLAGEEISLSGRITAVADAYDVITSKRSYKEPISHEAARQELVRCSGTQFDPTVVRALLEASLTERKTFAPLAWVFELPQALNVARLAATAPAASIASAAAVTVAATVGSAPPPPVPEALAFVETVETSTTLDDLSTTITIASSAGVSPSPSPAFGPPTPESTPTSAPEPSVGPPSPEPTTPPTTVPAPTVPPTAAVGAGPTTVTTTPTTVAAPAPTTAPIPAPAADAPAPTSSAGFDWQEYWRQYWEAYRRWLESQDRPTSPTTSGSTWSPPTTTAPTTTAPPPATTASDSGSGGGSGDRSRTDWNAPSDRSPRNSDRDSGGRNGGDRSGNRGSDRDGQRRGDRGD